MRVIKSTRNSVSNNNLFSIFCIVFLLFMQINSPSYASYEIVKAKTVDNENLEQEKVSDYMPTYNDPELPNFSPDNSIGCKLEKKLKGFIDKKKRKKNSILPEDSFGDTDAELETDNRTILQTQEKVSDKNKFQINADKITYDDTDGNVYANGHVEIISKAQNVTLKADNAVLDKNAQTIKLQDNVKILKDGTEMSGEYMLVDLNEQNILMDNPTLDAYSFIVKAQEGFLIANDIQMINGTIKSSKKIEYPFVSRGFQRLSPFGAENLYDRSLDLSDINPKKQTYTINSKEIILTCYKDHNSLILKNSDILHNNKKIMHRPDIEIISDKAYQVVETNSVEAGTLRNFGTYVGYGMLYRLPEGQTLKIMPALVYKSGLGVGILGRHQSPNSSLEAGWATASSNVVARGNYKIADGFNFRYGRHAYISEGFMGARRPGYAAQLEYNKSFLIDDLNLNFSHGIYAGLYSEYKEHNQENAYATTRFRYMAQLTKNILSYENKEQDLVIRLNALAQIAATVYGSGETAGVAKIGPTLSTKVKSWESTIGYLMGGIHGDSPFVFDKFRYGRSTIMLNEKFNFNNKFALGYRTLISPLKDNYEDDLITESRLYAMFGPDDVKIALSYDFIREIAHLDFMFLIGSETAKINFDRLITKNFDGSQEKRDFYKNSKRVKIEDNENI